MELLHTLGIDPYSFIIQVVGFIILVILLRKFLFTPVLGMLANRQKDISDTFDKIENDRKAAESLKQEYESRITQIEAEARTRIQEAIKEAQASKDTIVNEARDQASAIISRGKSEIENERDKAIVALRREVASLAVGAAGKILERNLDEEAHRKLVDDFINKVGN